MEHTNHFKSDLVSFELDGNFQYKPLIAEDELEMDLAYCYFNVEGVPTFDVRRFNILRLAHNLKVVPYSKETIKQITGQEKEWSELDVKDRIKLFLKLSSSVFEKILKKADEVDYGDALLKKKSNN